jgi:hypothetical protein
LFLPLIKGNVDIQTTVYNFQITQFSKKDVTKNNFLKSSVNIHHDIQSLLDLPALKVFIVWAPVDSSHRNLIYAEHVCGKIISKTLHHDRHIGKKRGSATQVKISNLDSTFF